MFAWDFISVHSQTAICSQMFTSGVSLILIAKAFAKQLHSASPMFEESEESSWTFQHLSKLWDLLPQTNFLNSPKCPPCSPNGPSDDSTLSIGTTRKQVTRLLFSIIHYTNYKLKKKKTDLKLSNRECINTGEVTRSNSWTCKLCRNFKICHKPPEPSKLCRIQ